METSISLHPTLSHSALLGESTADRLEGCGAETRLLHVLGVDL